LVKRYNPLSCEIVHYTVYYTYLLDPAGAPTQPKVDKITNNSISLSWNKPRDDGGALDKYVIEMKTPNGDWEWATEVPATLVNQTNKISVLI